MAEHFAYDVMLVLGAPLLLDGAPCELLADRLALALSWHGRCPVPVICCGGKRPRDPHPQSDAMCAWLAREGVPGDMLISEGQSLDTLQNIYYARAIMRAQGFERALVVTSDYHVPRAKAICRRYGVQAELAGSPTRKRLKRKAQAREILAWCEFVLTWKPYLNAEY